MIFVDSNIPMYLVGAAHPNKEGSRRLLEQCIAVRRPDAIQPAFDALLGVVDEVYPIERGDVEQAKALMLGLAPLSARDAVHVAVMRRRGVSRLLSFAAGFDAVGWVERLA